MSDGDKIAITPCARGCIEFAKHQPACTCTTECPDHDDHCTGCRPTEAEIGRFCKPCAHGLRDNIVAIPGLINELFRIGGGKTAPPDATTGDPTRRATKVDQISPAPALDAADEAERWINAWAVAVADERSERGPFQYHLNGIPEPNPRAEARYLTERLEHLTSAFYKLDITDEARELVARLTRAAGADEADQRIPTRCPNCGQRALVRPNGAEHIECRNKRCNVVWHSPAQIAQLTKVVAS